MFNLNFICAILTVRKAFWLEYILLNSFPRGPQRVISEIDEKGPSYVNKILEFSTSLGVSFFPFQV